MIVVIQPSDGQVLYQCGTSVIQRSDGRVLYACGTSPIPPTNPKAGSPTSGNTVVWNGRTHATTLIVPRQNPVQVDTWSPQSNLRHYSGPVTYAKPPFSQTEARPVSTGSGFTNNPCADKTLPNPCNTK